jgi:fused signal recognition particle receptor
MEGGGPVSEGWLARLRGGLQKAREGLLGKVQQALRGGRLDAASIEEIEAALLQADVGAEETDRLVAQLRELARRERAAPADVLDLLRRELAAELQGAQRGLQLLPPPGPSVILLVGVNGSGKTTTAAKLAHRLGREGHRVLLAAADTFRAAAAEQLAVWAERAGADLVRHSSGSDPGAVVFDAVQAARARGADVVVADTAGRLHNKANLMAELQKVVRVAGRACAGAPHETLLVLDASTGQNAIRQAQVFTEAVPVSGLVLAKLDTTAKGGTLIAVHRALGLPVLFTGIGEQLNDLEPFDPNAFVSALLGGEP